jgi:hypothetical protein
MTAQDILKSLEEIAEKISQILDSEAFKAIESHAEFETDDVTLVDSLRGVEETSSAIGYIMDLGITRFSLDCPEPDWLREDTDNPLVRGSYSEEFLADSRALETEGVYCQQNNE